MSNFSTATFSKFLKPQTEPAHLLVGGGGWGEENPTDLLALHAHLQVPAPSHQGAPAPIHQERPELWGRVHGGKDAALNAALNRPLDTVLEEDETLLSNAELGHGAPLWPIAQASSLFDEAVLSTSLHLDFLKQTVSKRLYPGVAHSQPAGAVLHDTDPPPLGLRPARLVWTQQDAQEAQEKPAEAAALATLSQDLSHITSKLEAAGSHLATDFLRGVKRLRQAAAQADDRQPHRSALASAQDPAQDLEPPAVSPGKSPRLQLSVRRQQASLTALSAIEMPSRPVLPIPRPCSLVLSAPVSLSSLPSWSSLPPLSSQPLEAVERHSLGHFLERHSLPAGLFCTREMWNSHLFAD